MFDIEAAKLFEASGDNSSMITEDQFNKIVSLMQDPLLRTKDDVKKLNFRRYIQSTCHNITADTNNDVELPTTAYLSNPMTKSLALILCTEESPIWEVFTTIFILCMLKCMQRHGLCIARSAQCLETSQECILIYLLRCAPLVLHSGYQKQKKPAIRQLLRKGSSNDTRLI